MEESCFAICEKFEVLMVAKKLACASLMLDSPLLQQSQEKESSLSFLLT